MGCIVTEAELKGQEVYRNTPGRIVMEQGAGCWVSCDTALSSAHDTARGARDIRPRYGHLRVAIRCDMPSKADKGKGIARAAQRAGARTSHRHDTALGPATRPTLGYDTTRVSATTRRLWGHDMACARAWCAGWASWGLMQPVWFLTWVFDSVVFLSHRLDSVHEHCSLQNFSEKKIFKFN